MADDRDNDGSKRSLIWTWIQSALVVAAVAVVIAQLVIVIQNRGMVQHAIRTSDAAQSTANQALGYTDEIGNITGQVSQLGTRTTELEGKLKNFTEKLNGLQSAVLELSSSVAAAIAMPSATESSASDYYYYSGGGVRAKGIPEAGSYAIMVGGAALILI